MLGGFSTSWRIPSEGKGIMYPLWAIHVEGEKESRMVCWGGGKELCVRGVTNRTGTFNPAISSPWLALCWVEKDENPDQVLEEVKRTPLYAQLLEMEEQGHFDAVFKKE